MIEVLVVGGLATAVGVAAYIAAKTRTGPPHIPPGRATVPASTHPPVRYTPGQATLPTVEETVHRIVREGMWCPRCLQDTGVEVDLVTCEGILATLRGCARCRSGICHDWPSP